MGVASALSYDGVSKDYLYSHLGRTTVTRGVAELNLQVAAGEAVGLLGLNGSGKTTTMKLALGLLAPTRGAVLVFGSPAGGRETRRRMGYLPELPYFQPYLTPAETLRLFGRLSGLGAAELGGRIAESLERVGLSAQADRRMTGFSKGMLQRVGMAQCLLHDPQLLLLDEPVSGLDPLAIAEFRDLLGRLREAGVALLIASHSISELERVCDRAAILADGRVARVAAQSEWSASPGRLEDIFVETVRPAAQTLGPAARAA